MQFPLLKGGRGMLPLNLSKNIPLSPFKGGKYRANLRNLNKTLTFENLEKQNLTALMHDLKFMMYDFFALKYIENLNSNYSTAYCPTAYCTLPAATFFRY